jgi:DNA-binding beta-propeller fold protein YncE
VECASGVRTPSSAHLATSKITTFSPSAPGRRRAGRLAAGAPILQFNIPNSTFNISPALSLSRSVKILPMRAPVLLFTLATLTASSLLAEKRAVVRTVAGVPGVAGYADGAAGSATFNKPTWLDVDRKTGAIYVVDRSNGALRKLRAGAVSTLKVGGGFYQPDPILFHFDGPMAGGIAIEPATGGCGAAQWAYGMFVASTGSHQIIYVVDYFDYGQGELAARDDSSPFLGGANVAGHRDGEQSRVLFNSPTGVALSWDFIGRNYDRDRVYIADTGNHVIRRVKFRMSFEACPQPYFFDTMAGVPGEAGSNDGTEARFNAPRGLAAAPDGSLYVADTGNHTIRRILPDGRVETVAGAAGVSGAIDGLALDARLNTPTGLAVNELGELFIADTGNSLIRKLTLDGQLVTVAGTPGIGGHLDGSARTARFNGPVGIRLVGDSILVADTSNHVIRRIDFEEAGRGRPIRR